jgi:hypothetical protein
MSTDAESAPKRRDEKPQSLPPKKKKKKGAAKSRKISRPLTEAEINVPDIQTLVMLGVLAVLAVVLWVFAHAGCNYHPPRETRRPRDVTTAELTREPKDAAIEFQHRRLTLNYKGALEIAAGGLVDQVKQERQACEANAAACAQRRKAAADVAISSAVVLERTPTSAKVKVTTYRIPGGDRTFLTLVERAPDGWKVTAQVPDAPGATLPAPIFPSQHPVQINLTPTPAPTSSAGAAGSAPAPAGSHPGASQLPPGHPITAPSPAHS